MKIKYTEVLKVVKGEWNKIPAGEFTNFAVDSRKILLSGLFFALKGDKTDGHLFVGDAVKNGAKGAVVERELAKEESVFVLKAESSKEALFSLGSYARSLLRAKVVGVTGSSGKTTTKEMIALALKTNFSVSATKGNANTEYSIPLFFLNDASLFDDFCVAEMGIQKKGDMDTLLKIASPDVAVLLNAGKSHLEFLKSVKEVAREKFKLARFVSDKNGVCVVNGDDKEFFSLSESLSVKPVFFGFGPRNDVRARIKSVSAEEMTLEIFSFGGKSIRTFPFSGVHYAYDILATVAVSEALGADLDSILSALERFKPVSGRGNVYIFPGGRVVFDETYNSNPLSLEYSLSRFKNRRKRLCVIVGDMLELGEMSEKAHEEAGKIIASFVPDCVITFGEYSRLIGDACKKAGIKNVRSFSEKDSLLKYIKEMPVPEETFIFIKGSRGMKMEDVLKILKERFEGNE